MESSNCSTSICSGINTDSTIFFVHYLCLFTAISSSDITTTKPANTTTVPIVYTTICRTFTDVICVVL